MILIAMDRDDLFVGSMGVIMRIKDKGMINDFEPNLLLLSTQRWPDGRCKSPY